MADKTTLTTASGMPVDDDQNTLTAGPRGPALMQDVHLLEKLAHFNRERIPERVVHAKGAGAHGVFECTADMSAYTRAQFLSKAGKTTEVFARFSTVGGEKGSPDAARDPRGFAVKFYTEEGNYDKTGNNTPVFFPTFSRNFAPVYFVTSSVTSNQPCAPAPLAWTTRSGIRSRLKWASLSCRWTSGSSV